jgi:hypothetical protein
VELVGPDDVVASRDVLLNTETGYLQIAPSAEYTIQVNVMATDSASDSVLVRTFTFTSFPADTSTAANGPDGLDCEAGTRLDTVRYDSAFSCDCSSTTTRGTYCQLLPSLDIGDWAQELPDGEVESDYVFLAENRAKWARGTEYHIPPINVTTATVSGTTESVTYALVWEVSPPPRGFFIESNTGEMLVSIPDSAGTYTTSVVAKAENALAQVLYNITFEFLTEDTLDETNGPNGRECTSGDTVDAVEFDGIFTCSCDASTVEPNCDAAPEASAAAADSAATTAYISIGALVGLCVLVVLASRYQVYRAQHRPQDMNLVAAELLASLGMGDMALDIKPDEIGMSLTFTKSMEAHSDIDDADTLAEQLLTSLRKLSGLPSKLSAMLKAESTTATVDAAHQTGLIRMKRPTDYELKPGAEEDYASALHHAAGRKHVRVDGGEYGTHFAEDVAVAIPRRVPTELDRHHILRLEMLGEGNFGEASLALELWAWVLSSSYCRPVLYLVICTGADCGN